MCVCVCMRMSAFSLTRTNAHTHTHSLSLCVCFLGHKQRNSQHGAFSLEGLVAESGVVIEEVKEGGGEGGGVLSSSLPSASGLTSGVPKTLLSGSSSVPSTFTGSTSAAAVTLPSVSVPGASALSPSHTSKLTDAKAATSNLSASPASDLPPVPALSPPPPPPSLPIAPPPPLPIDGAESASALAGATAASDATTAAATSASTAGPDDSSAGADVKGAALVPTETSAVMTQAAGLGGLGVGAGGIKKTVIPMINVDVKRLLDGVIAQTNMPSALFTAPCLINLWKSREEPGKEHLWMEQLIDLAEDMLGVPREVLRAILMFSQNDPEATNFMSGVIGFRYTGLAKLLVAVMLDNQRKVRALLQSDESVRFFCSECLRVSPETLMGFVGLCQGSRVDGCAIAMDISKGAADYDHYQAALPALRLLDAPIHNLDQLTKTISVIASSKLETAVIVTVADLFNNTLYASDKVTPFKTIMSLANNGLGTSLINLEMRPETAEALNHVASWSLFEEPALRQELQDAFEGLTQVCVFVAHTHARAKARTNKTHSTSAP